MKLNILSLLDKWNIVKKNIQAKANLPFFKEGEIWWCGIGQNIGVETFGKNDSFSRPVLIYKKFDKNSFLGICLTSKNKVGSWYIKIDFQNELKTVNLAQTRTTSAYRLYRKMGEIDENDFNKIKQGFTKLYCQK